MSRRTKPFALAIAAFVLLVSSCASAEPTTTDTLDCEAAEPESESTTTETSAATTRSTSTMTTQSTTAAGPTTAEATTTTEPTTTATTEATTTTEPTTTATTEAPTTLDPNDMVVRAQILLTDLGYWPGPIDGEPGLSTSHAVIAFQKLNGLPTTGTVDTNLVAVLENAERPPAQDPSRPGLEIDLSHQVARLVVDGAVRWVFDISTGTPATPTPPGEFAVTRQIDGYRVAPLGTLYRPKYFNGGIALHGYSSVPTTPASHGCVRLTYPAMDLLWSEGHLPVGGRVTVYR